MLQVVGTSTKAFKDTFKPWAKFAWPFAEDIDYVFLFALKRNVAGCWHVGASLNPKKLVFAVLEYLNQRNILPSGYLRAALKQKLYTADFPGTKSTVIKVIV